MHKTDSYWEKFNVGELDIIVCMFSNKLNEHDVNFFNLAIERSQDVIFVRSKADDLYDPELSVEELKVEIENTYIKKEFGNQHSLLFISAKDSQRKGVESPKAQEYLKPLAEKVSSKSNSKGNAKTKLFINGGVSFFSTYMIGVQTITSCKEIAETLLGEEVEEAATKSH